MLMHVLTTWAIAWIDQSMPYFPIEISRTATGKIGKYYFPAGFVVVGYFLWIESACCEPRWLKLSPTVGVVLAAIVNDEYHWQTHLFGVFLMYIAILGNVLYSNLTRDWILFALATWLLHISAFLKTVAVLEEPLNWRCWKKNILEERDSFVDKCMQINYKGEGTKAQLVIYRVTGVCQWVALGLLINIY